MKWFLRGCACVVVLLSSGDLHAGGRDEPLVDAAKRVDGQAVRSLLARSVDVNARDTEGATALHWAVHRDAADLVDVLIHAGADVRAVNDLGVAPISLACVNGNAAIVGMLLSAGADPNTSLPEGETVLMTAARTGSDRIVDALLARGADPNARERWRGQTALMWAAAQKHPAVVRMLASRGADVRVRSAAGFTALLFAIRAGDVDSTRLLLDAGANVNEGLPEGSSALMIAIQNAHYELAALLLDRGADPNTAGAGWSPLHELIRSRNPDKGAMPEPVPTGTLNSLELAKRLVARGANPNAVMIKAPGTIYPLLNLVGATPFLLAAKNADVSMMQLLVAGGGDPSVPTADGATPLMVAAGLGYSQGNSPGTDADALRAVELCLNLCGDVQAADNSGNTALHGVALRGTLPIVKLLVEKGARLDATNSEGWMPVTVAQGVHIWPNFRAQLPAAALLRQLMSERTTAVVAPKP